MPGNDSITTDTMLKIVDNLSGIFQANSLFFNSHTQSKATSKSSLEDSSLGSGQESASQSHPRSSDKEWSSDQKSVYEMQLENLQEQLVDIMIENQTLGNQLSIAWFKSCVKKQQDLISVYYEKSQVFSAGHIHLPLIKIKGYVYFIYQFRPNFLRSQYLFYKDQFRIQLLLSVIGDQL